MIFFLPLFIAISLAFFMRLYFFEVYSVNSSSMKPTILNGDYILVSKYKKNDIKKGDVVAFEKDSIIYVKRVLAFAGDYVKMLGTNTYINHIKIKSAASTNVKMYSILSYGEMLFEETINNKTYFTIYLNNDINYESQVNSHFMLGDNRSNSEDSRFWLANDKIKIIGKVEFVFFSVEPKNKKINWKRFFKIIK